MRMGGKNLWLGLGLHVHIMSHNYLETFGFYYTNISCLTGCGLDSPGIGSWWGGEIFSSCPDQPWGPPGLLYNRYWVSFPRRKQPEREVDHPPSYCTKVKEIVEVYLCSSSGALWCCTGGSCPWQRSRPSPLGVGGWLSTTSTNFGSVWPSSGCAVNWNSGRYKWFSPPEGVPTLTQWWGLRGHMNLRAMLAVACYW